MKQETELWSLKEKRTYTMANARREFVSGAIILVSPSGEPLVTKVR